MADTSLRESRPPQAIAADPRVHVGVTANAGSGKTTVLVNRVVRLLRAGSAPDRILCLTYTKAAAGEMQERLYDRLGRWATADDASLAADIERLEDAPAPADLGPDRALFARALETPGGLKIQTIHAFCERLLRRFPIEAGIEPGFRILDDAEAVRLRREAWSRLAETLPGNRRLAAAIEHLATRSGAAVDTGVFDWIAQRPEDLDAALAPHGGDVEAAVAALEAELDVGPGETGDDVLARFWAEAPRDRLSAAMSALLQASGKTDVDRGGALESTFAAADAEGPVAAGARYLDFFFTEKGELYKSFANAPTMKAAPVLGALFGTKDARGPEPLRAEEARKRFHAANTVRDAEARLRLAAGLAGAYARRKAELGALDFADLIGRARALVTVAEARDWVRYKLDGGVEHLLVDEAQDTSPVQWELISALAAEIFAGAGARGEGRTVFAVGDEKQSIYSFQGAEPEGFRRFRSNAVARVGERFAAPKLETSYRSAPAVLSAVDAMLAAAADAGLAIGADRAADPIRHLAARSGAPGAVEVWPTVPVPEAAEPPGDWGEPVDRPPDPEAAPAAVLARAIAERIRDWTARGLLVRTRGADGAETDRPLRPGDVMILVRSRKGALFGNLIRALERARVPVAGADRLVLREAAAVEDLIGAARVALLPEDDLALAELLRSPLLHPADRAEPPIDEAALFDLAHGRPGRLWPQLQATNDPRFAEAKAFVADLTARAGIEPPHAFFAGLLDRISATGETYARRLVQRLGPDSVDPVEVLIERALAHDRDADPSLDRFVREILEDHIEVKREGSGGRDVVRVMTIHGAKGLEAPIVILPDTGRLAGGGGQASRPLLTADGLPVWLRRAEEAPELVLKLEADRKAKEASEQLRLLYVAATRARDRVIVCGYAKKRGDEPPTWRGLVRAGLERLGAEVVETPVAATGTEAGLLWGDPPQFASGAQAPAAITAVEVAGAPVWANTRAPDAPPALRALRAAHLAEDEDPTPVGSPLGAQSPGGARRGALIHRLLETLPEIAPTRRADAAARFLAAHAELTPDARSAIAAETLAVLNDPAFAQVFGPGSRAEVAIIGAAPGLPAGTVVNGRIDRLAITDGEVLIVDFKTNRPAPRSPELVDPAHLRQMAAYRAVLRALYPSRPVRCALVWTEAPRLMALPETLLDAALSRP